MKRMLIVLLALAAVYVLPASAADLTGEVNIFASLPDNPGIVVNWGKANFQMMTGQGLIENLQPRFASGNIPDVFSFELDDFSKSQVAAGKIADLGDTRAWSELVPAMQSAWTSNGVKYGISGGVCTTLLFYNMDYFKKAGITTLPKDWDEFLAACEKLATTRYDFSKNPGWLEVYQKMDILNKKGYFMKGFLSTDYGQGQEYFNKGDAAMLFAGTWQAAYIIDKGNFQTGLFLPPWNNAGKELVVLNASETGWAVGKNGNEKLGKVLLDSMFADNWAIYQNPRGCVTPFKTQKGDKLNPKLAAAMADLNKYPKFTDLWGRELPAAVGTVGRTLSQSLYVDKSPADIIPLLTKAQNDWFATKQVAPDRTRGAGAPRVLRFWNGQEGAPCGRGR